jgi:hypothetical protein
MRPWNVERMGSGVAAVLECIIHMRLYKLQRNSNLSMSIRFKSALYISTQRSLSP